MRITVTTLLLLTAGTALAADALAELLAVLDQRMAIECDSRRLIAQYQKARGSPDQRALEQKMAEVNKRSAEAERKFQGKDIESMARALSAADQQKVREYSAALIERCNATLPPEGRLPLP